MDKDVTFQQQVRQPRLYLCGRRGRPALPRRARPARPDLPGSRRRPLPRRPGKCQDRGRHAPHSPAHDSQPHFDYPGDIADTRDLRDSQRRMRAAGLFMNKPQDGIEPKISFRQPDLDGQHRDRRFSTNSPAAGRRKMRGQSPDDASRRPNSRRRSRTVVRGQSPDPVALLRSTAGFAGSHALELWRPRPPPAKCRWARRGPPRCRPEAMPGEARRQCRARAVHAASADGPPPGGYGHHAAGHGTPPPTRRRCSPIRRHSPYAPHTQPYAPQPNPIQAVPPPLSRSTRRLRTTGQYAQPSGGYPGGAYPGIAYPGNAYPGTAPGSSRSRDRDSPAPFMPGVAPITPGGACCAGTVASRRPVTTMAISFSRPTPIRCSRTK